MWYGALVILTVSILASFMPADCPTSGYEASSTGARSQGVGRCRQRGRKRHGGDLVFLVAVGGTTHRALFLEQPVRLPVFGVDLPLVGFYWVTPALFVFLHFYVLVQLTTLAGKVEMFLDAAVLEGREALRFQCRRLDPFPVVQMMIAQRLGDRAIALRVMTWITFVIGPVVLLLFFQLRFLPYHDVATAWVHRILLGVDLALLWLFWPPRTTSAGWDWMRRTRVTFAMLTGASILLFATMVATVQNENAETAADWCDQWFPGHGEPFAALRSFLFDGEVKPETQRSASLFARRLVVRSQDLVGLDDAALEKSQRTLILRARDLRHAVFDWTDLRKADLGYARLDGASFIGARLQDVNFEHANMPQVRFSGAKLQGARFEKTSIPNSRFNDAQLQGTVFDDVDLTNSDFSRSKLQGATFYHANLNGATLVDVHLQGGAINKSALLGASFVRSNLQGVDFRRNTLRGTDFRGSRLEGTDFREVQFRGARFDGKGDLFIPRFGGLIISLPAEAANIWRAQGLAPDVFDPAAIRVIAPTEDRSQLVQDWLASIPKREMRDAANRRLSVFSKPGDDDEFASSRTLTRIDSEQLPEWFANVICPAEGSPYTARIAIESYLATRPQAPPYARAVAERLLEQASVPDRCPGLQNLSEYIAGCSDFSLTMIAQRRRDLTRACPQSLPAQ